jgi:hypothetical protein
VRVFEEVGEITPAPSTYRYVTLPGIDQKFDGFYRNPYLATFTAGGVTFSLVNVHLYFGSDSSVSKTRRSLETYAVALGRRAPKEQVRLHPRHHSARRFQPPNDPAGRPDLRRVDQTRPAAPTSLDPDCLRDRDGLSLRPSRLVPGETQDDFEQAGVVDFDGAVFASLWQSRPLKDFEAYVRYYLSDHRPLWAAFRI